MQSGRKFTHNVGTKRKPVFFFNLLSFFHNSPQNELRNGKKERERVLVFSSLKVSFVKTLNLSPVKPMY